jgi:lysophospholipase L1-like esterase
MLSRRTLLLGALAGALASCSSSQALDGRPDASSDPPTDGSNPSTSGGQRDDPPPPTTVAMVGDSITLGSKAELEEMFARLGFTTVTIDAENSRRIEEGGRKPRPGLDAIEGLLDDSPPGLWVIALGTNDVGKYATDEDYADLVHKVLDDIGGDVPLAWIDVYLAHAVDESAEFNGVVRDALADRPRTAIGRWFEQCESTERRILSDGIHPNEPGQIVFAEAVRVATAACLG